MIKIEKIYGDEILDSRGNPTVAVTVQLNSGYSGTGISPGGASTGKYEAVESVTKAHRALAVRASLKASR